jgi:hypothetical protein
LVDRKGLMPNLRWRILGGHVVVVRKMEMFKNRNKTIALVSKKMSLETRG